MADFLGYDYGDVVRYETNNRNDQTTQNLTYVGGITTAYQYNIDLTILTNTGDLARDLMLHFEEHSTTIPFEIEMPQHPSTINFPNTFIAQGRTFSTDGGGLFISRTSIIPDADLESAKGRYFTFTGSRKVHRIKELVRERNRTYRIVTDHLILTSRSAVNIQHTPNIRVRYKQSSPTSTSIVGGIVHARRVVSLIEDLE